jgi:hypothetical protein
MGRSEEKQQAGGQATALFRDDRGYVLVSAITSGSRNLISNQIISSRTLLNDDPLQ